MTNWGKNGYDILHTNLQKKITLQFAVTFLFQQESPPALTRKRHTDRGVPSPRYAVLVGGGGGTYPGGGEGGTYPGGGEEVPTLVGGRGYLPWWGEGYLP